MMLLFCTAVLITIAYGCILKLVPKLENVYGFRLCIHHRDFLVGADIVDNIEQSILRSRKVIVVMSENCLRSQWCMDEIQMTWNVDRKKFVVIMYKDVLLSNVHIPPFCSKSFRI